MWDVFSAKHEPDNSVKQRRGGKNVPIFANANMYTQKYKYIYKYDANIDMILQIRSYSKISSKMKETGFPDYFDFYANGQKPERVQFCRIWGR